VKTIYTAVSLHPLGEYNMMLFAPIPPVSVGRVINKGRSGIRNKGWERGTDREERNWEGKKAREEKGQ